MGVRPRPPGTVGRPFEDLVDVCVGLALEFGWSPRDVLTLTLDEIEAWAQGLWRVRQRQRQTAADGDTFIGPDVDEVRAMEAEARRCSCGQ